MFNKLIIDSTYSRTDLCELGVKYPTDKSPYNQNPNLHKHAYTAIYDMLFSSLRSREINLGEIGILDNNSIKCWWSYFPNATICGFENDQNRINNALEDNLDGWVCYYNLDVKSSARSLNEGLSKFGEKFDILIDDSTHEFQDQINVIKEGFKFLKNGGYLIIEDIFKKEDENRYYEALKDLIPYFSSIFFVEANHKDMSSPGWDNDKLLILVRNDKPFRE